VTNREGQGEVFQLDAELLWPHLTKYSPLDSAVAHYSALWTKQQLALLAEFIEVQPCRAFFSVTKWQGQLEQNHENPQVHESTEFASTEGLKYSSSIVAHCNLVIF
jgi:hypothetical protein